jgi:hypothetical protein
MKPFPHFVRHLEEKPGVGRLGRHIHHDPRSRAFAYTSTKPLVTKTWERHCAPFDQGDLGSCTGNAMAGALMTDGLYKPGRSLAEPDAVQLYSAATLLDAIAGHYPPDDTGSTGLAVAKAAKRAAFLKSYRHAFSLQAALAAISHAGPVIIGISWYEGFDTPKGKGALLSISGEVRGGHEIEVNSIDVERKLIGGPNSWGTSWGAAGYWTMSFDTFGTLLTQGGDVVVPVSS